MLHVNSLNFHQKAKENVCKCRLIHNQMYGRKKFPNLKTNQNMQNEMGYMNTNIANTNFVCIPT
jgi:hypothetical protein